MKDLVILGAGGFAKEASLLVEEINESRRGEENAYNRENKTWNLLGFIDKDEAKWGLELRGYPVLGGWDALKEVPENAYVICVVGEPASKKKMVETAAAQGRKFAKLIHPEVELASDVHLGEGVLINKGCMLTTDITIGDHVSINPGCGIGHDAVIRDYSTLMWHVNISGAVEVGEGCMIGTKATVLQGKSIGSWSIVGAGAVVNDNLPGGCTAVGVPAKVVGEK